MVHPNLSYPETGGAMPQNKASLARRNKFNSASQTLLEQEWFPISITFTGNIAAAQYGYRVVRENHKKDRETVTGHYTDALLEVGGSWRFIAWAGGDDPKQ